MRFENCMKTPLKNDLKTKESQVGKPSDLASGQKCSTDQFYLITCQGRSWISLSSLEVSRLTLISWQWILGRVTVTTTLSSLNLQREKGVKQGAARILFRMVGTGKARG
jgi:hypothetical protein